MKAKDAELRLKEEIIKPDPEDELAADRLKNAAATKKLAIFDAFEIVNRSQQEEDMLNEKPKTNIENNDLCFFNMYFKAAKLLGHIPSNQPS